MGESTYSSSPEEWEKGSRESSERDAGGKGEGFTGAMKVMSLWAL
jgi:hypothetical protein